MQDNGEWMGPEESGSASAPNNEGVWDLSRPVPSPVSRPDTSLCERSLRQSVEVFGEMVGALHMDDPAFASQYAALTQMRIGLAHLRQSARLIEQNDIILNRLDQIACNQR